jgi:citrate lyase subunit beta/citryl-CoA lyase
VVKPALSGLVQPKIQSPLDVTKMDALCEAIELETGRPSGDLMLYPIFETANSLRLGYEIAMASPRIKYMGGAVSRFGDIHQAIGFRWTAEGRESLFLRSKLLIDARAAGVRYPISGMWGGGLHDIDGLRRWANELRDPRLLRHDDRCRRTRRDRQRGLLADRRRDQVLERARPARS